MAITLKEWRELRKNSQTSKPMVNNTMQKVKDWEDAYQEFLAIKECAERMGVKGNWNFGGVIYDVTS